MRILFFYEKLHQSNGISHFPVLLNEVIEICGFQKGKDFLDCTFGELVTLSQFLKCPTLTSQL